MKKKILAATKFKDRGRGKRASSDDSDSVLLGRLTLRTPLIPGQTLWV